MGTPGAGQRFDVVIVGARCAGAALAAHLASRGLSVLALDAATLPSDQPNSTHLVQPPGMDELDHLGVGATVRAASPALEALRLSYDGHEALLPYGEGRAAHCLRRESLDSSIQAAAVDAGAELRPETRVVELIRREDGRVTGVTARRSGGPPERILADMVVGADGRNSTVAKLVEAEEYLGYDAPRAVYWSYWRRPAGWDPHVLDNTFEGEHARVIFPTDGDLLLIATVPPLATARAWRGDHASAYLADIRAYRPLNVHLGDDLPVEPVRGAFRLRYFFRASAGPGWALIGDAGHHKEFVIGLGISDALRDARGLAAAVIENDPAATERWWRRRDIERIEMYHWSRDLGRARAVDALQRLTGKRLAAEPDLHHRFGEIVDGGRSPYDLVPGGRVARWLSAALLRGEAAIVPPLLDGARRRALARQELRRRQRLARRVEPHSLTAPDLHRRVGRYPGLTA